MKKFELIGLASPGKINLPVYGTIELEKIDDTLAEKLFREGLPYLQPKVEHLKEMYPGEKHPEPQMLDAKPPAKAKKGKK
ncbi:MAG: hypothetical protein IH597_15000 [Bacteroidales bacterium]|nr:hypothetical protein [Bacteroidales bacterium]